MPTLITVAEMLKKSYLDWYRKGIDGGVWDQRGVFWLEGVAGIGKTEILYQIAQQIRGGENIDNCKIVELFVSSAMDPESVAGTPGMVVDTLPSGEKIHVLKMHYREEIVSAIKRGPGAILFLDEVGREPRHMRPLMLKLLSPQKTLAGLDIGQMFIVTAGNPPDDEHMVDSLLEDAAIASRLIRVRVEPDTEEWSDWMYRKTPTHREIANFILENTTMLVGRDKTGEANSAFHSPRSWDIAACQLHIHGGGTDEAPATMTEANALTVVNGIVGSQAGMALKAFMTKDRPMSVKHILEGRVSPGPGGRINAVPPSVLKSLQYHLQHKQLDDPQADNLKKFFEAIPADVASALARNHRALHPANLMKLTARGIFGSFVQKVHKAKRAVDPNAAPTP